MNKQSVGNFSSAQHSEGLIKYDHEYSRVFHTLIPSRPSGAYKYPSARCHQYSISLILTLELEPKIPFDFRDRRLDISPAPLVMGDCPGG
jgi:hypothetical protein